MDLEAQLRRVIEERDALKAEINYMKSVMQALIDWQPTQQRLVLPSMEKR